MKINPEKFYTAKQIADMGVMTATKPDTKRQMLLRYIRNGEIEAVNVGGEKKPRYLVQGKHLIAYRDRQVKPGEYTKK